MPFEEIYKSTFQYVYRYFYYKSVNQAEIEDLAHDVYMRFYTKYSDKDIGVDEAKRILFGFCRNMYKEWVRKAVKEMKSEFFDNCEYEDLVETFEDEEFEKKLDIQKTLIKEALTKLNPKIQFVLESRFIHNMSRKEIADKLGIKEKDVHTYQKRGIKYLKKIVNDSGK